MHRGELAIHRAASGGAVAPPGPDQAKLSAGARAAMEKGIRAETRRGYAGDWQRFEAWALGEGVCPLPCSAESLTEYVTFLTVFPRPRTGMPYKPAPIERAMAAIAVAHKAAGLAPPGTTGARLVLRGYERELKENKDPRGRIAKAAAATPIILRTMIAHTDLTTPIGLRDAAALTNGFALAARSSEAKLLDWEDAADVEQGLEYDLYRPKVNNDQPLGVPYGAYSSTCPVRRLHAWRRCLLDLGHPATGPIYVRINRHGHINPPMTRRGKPIGDPSGRMTTEGIAEIVTRAAKRAGLMAVPDDLLPSLPPRWSGHSLRRGYAKAAREAKKDMLESGRHGGWADGSRAFAGYFDRAAIWDEELNPLFGIGL